MYAIRSYYAIVRRDVYARGVGESRGDVAVRIALFQVDAGTVGIAGLET